MAEILNIPGPKKFAAASRGAVLKLDDEEVQVLYSILRLVGGSPSMSRRSVADRIYQTLENSTIEFDTDSEDVIGQIEFKNVS